MVKADSYLEKILRVESHLRTHLPYIHCKVQLEHALQACLNLFEYAHHLFTFFPKPAITLLFHMLVSSPSPSVYRITY